MEGSQGGVVSARFGALETVRSRFAGWSGDLASAVAPVGSGFDDVMAGDGQFASQVRPGAVWFLLSWKQALGLFEQSAGLIAANTGRTVVDLQATDESWEIRL
ncbi:MAG: hypothetical protein QG608_2964 [Actinomycetota bacterium]|nr:hypothetical protein [Actinomycetota bacterium]